MKLKNSQEKTLKWIASQYGVVRLDGDILRAVEPNPHDSKNYPSKKDSAVPAFHMLLDGVLFTKDKLLYISDKGWQIVSILGMLDAGVKAQKKSREPKSTPRGEG